MSRRSIILDTDIGPDCDDAAALALTCIYTSKLNYELAAVTHCTSCPWGVGAIRSILKWYGHADALVGTLSDRDLLDDESSAKYNRALAMRVSENERKAPDSTAVLRKTLAQSEDGAVDIIGIGPQRNIAQLLASPADDISPLSGRELIAHKVHRLTLMGAAFSPDGTADAEWNILMDIPSARTVAEDWPTPIVYNGFDVGAQVITLKNRSRLRADNPVKIAYDLYCGENGRMSWDLCTVQQAICERSDLYELSEPGTVEIDRIGCAHFKPCKCGRHRYVKLNVPPEAAARDLENELETFDRTHA